MDQIPGEDGFDDDGFGDLKDLINKVEAAEAQSAEKQKNKAHGRVQRKQLKQQMKVISRISSQTEKMNSLAMKQANTKKSLMILLMF